MTTSTPPVLLAGVDRHGDKYRVRKSSNAWRSPARPDGRVVELYATPDLANGRALELDARRKAGLPPSDTQGGMTLGDAAELALKGKQRARQRGKLRDKGLDYWVAAFKPWREGPHAGTPLTLLNRNTLADLLDDRADRAPWAAQTERAGLLLALNCAADRGATFDVALLRLPTIERTPRRRRALDALELEWFAAYVKPYARRLVLFEGTVGNRIEELWLAEPGHLRLDGDKPVLFVPAANCKEADDKGIPLTPEEVLLAREQLGGLHVVDASSPTSGCPTTPPGSPRLWTRPGYQVYPTGRVYRSRERPSPWGHTAWNRLVWQPAVTAAAAAWRAEHGLADRDATPFEWWVDPAAEPPDARRRDDDGRRYITSHDLRSTAVTLMRDHGMSREECAARVGHHDAGRLVNAVYDQGDRTERARKGLAAASAAGGLRAAAIGGRS